MEKAVSGPWRGNGKSLTQTRKASFPGGAAEISWLWGVMRGSLGDDELGNLKHH